MLTECRPRICLRPGNFEESESIEGPPDRCRSITAEWRVASLSRVEGGKSVKTCNGTKVVDSGRGSQDIGAAYSM